LFELMLQVQSKEMSKEEVDALKEVTRKYLNA
jgi:hypothetical protein